MVLRTVLLVEIGLRNWFDRQCETVPQSVGGGGEPLGRGLFNAYILDVLELLGTVSSRLRASRHPIFVVVGINHLLCEILYGHSTRNVEVALIEVQTIRLSVPENDSTALLLTLHDVERTARGSNYIRTTVRALAESLRCRKLVLQDERSIQRLRQLRFGHTKLNAMKARCGLVRKCLTDVREESQYCCYE